MKFKPGNIYKLNEILRLKNIESGDEEIFYEGTRLEHTSSPWKDECHFLVLGRDDMNISLTKEHANKILIEEEPESVIKISENLYLTEPLGDTSGNRIEVTRGKEDAYRFKDKQSIETHLSKFSGAEVEEL